jgi:hypothetical protein
MRRRTRRAPAPPLPLLLTLLAVTALAPSPPPLATNGARSVPRAPPQPRLEPPQGPLFAALAAVRMLS